MSQLLKTLEPSFSVSSHNFGNGNVRPILKIEYKDTQFKTVKKRAILLENLDMVEDFSRDLLDNHTQFYIRLLNFSLKNIRPEFKIVHTIIQNVSKKS